jgi:hypothetical protein
MRMPRSLGVVATAFLALGLGLGIGGAAFSNYFASSGTNRDGAYAIGRSQSDESNAKTAPDGVDRPSSAHGKADRKDHPKDSERYGARRSAERDLSGNDGGSPGDVAQHGSDNNRTYQSPTSNAEAPQASVFVPVGSGGCGHTAPPSDAKPAAAPSNRTGTDQKQAQPNLDGDGRAGGTGGDDVSPTGTAENGTRQTARLVASTKQVNIYVSISVWVKHSSVLAVQSNWPRNTARSSNSNWTSRDHNQSSASSTTTEQVNVDASIAVAAGGDGGGRVHQDSSARAQSSSHHGNDPGQDAGRGEAAPSGPDD